jgi:rhodanese-related sulfurtransferase
MMAKAMPSSTVLLLYINLLFGFLHNAFSYETLTAEGFFTLKDSVDAVIDVRTLSEWESGHIEGAMLVEELASYGKACQVTTPMDLKGCEYCDIIVYCRSGNRAGAALTILQNAGFKGRLYNGLGVSQWTDANYPLVNTPSIAAPCTYNATVNQQCYTDWLSNQASGKVVVLEEKDSGANNSGSLSLTTCGFSGMFIVGLAFAFTLLV